MDVRTISYVYEAFVSAGPDLTYNFGPRGMNGFGRGRMPTYADLQMEHDSVGAQRSYLANETNFRALKEMEDGLAAMGEAELRPQSHVDVEVFTEWRKRM